MNTIVFKRNKFKERTHCNFHFRNNDYATSNSSNNNKQRQYFFITGRTSIAY